MLFPLAWCEVVKSRVDAAGVVPVDPFEDRPACLGAGGEHLSLDALAFE